MNFTPPGPDCALCPRLVDYRCANRAKYPAEFNAPVPPFGSLDTPFLITGLAPGLQGANFTGRPFTGDYAGDLLYATLLKFGFAEGDYRERADDGLVLKGCRITNAVRCVPPENKPMPAEINTCNDFLAGEMAAMPNLRVVLALGLVAHQAVLKARGEKQAAWRFAHGARHDLPGVVLVNSYHCSRYNTNTGRLTEAMFHGVFETIVSLCAGAPV